MAKELAFLFDSFRDGHFYMAALVTTLLLLLTSITFFFYRRLQTKPDTILFVGLASSGKTTIFGKLINPANQWVTYTSVKENKYSEFINSKGQILKLIDYPGSESFRKILFQKWLGQERKFLKCIIFVVDSANFNKKDVAEFLYDILYQLKGCKGMPVLVACNKQDVGHAKSAQLIKKSIEQEFGLINISREAALSSTDASEQKCILTSNGREFKWSDLVGERQPDFTECSAEDGKEFSLSPVREWIEAY